MRRRRARRAGALGATAAAWLALPAVASAHGIVGRADLPIPAELFGVAAAAVLVVSFLALAAGWSEPRLQSPRGRPLLRVPRAADAIAGVVGVAAFAAVVYAGLAGTDSQQDNLAPIAVYVVFWVGIPFASLLAGDVFRVLSPWRAIGRAAGWIAGKAGSAGAADPLPYPPASASGPRSPAWSPSACASCAGRRGATPRPWRSSRSSTPRSSSWG